MGLHVYATLLCCSVGAWQQGDGLGSHPLCCRVVVAAVLWPHSVAAGSRSAGKGSACLKAAGRRMLYARMCDKVRCSRGMQYVSCSVDAF
jgi:hypothetical protein